MNKIKAILGVTAMLTAIVLGSQSCYYDKYDDLNPKDTTTAPVDTTDTTNCDTCATVKVKYSSDVKAIFDAHCISCHSTSGTNQSPFLDTYINSKNAVQLGDVINRINGVGNLMPDGGPKMSDANIALVQKWKTDGYQQ